jgi:predicted aconitase
LRGLERLGLEELKSLLASMAASGSHALAVIEGVTPTGTYRVEVVDKVFVERGDLEGYLGDDIAPSETVLGYIGCPHLHPQELLYILRLVRKYGRVKRGRLLVTIPPEYVERFRPLIYELKARGVDIAAGTCPVVSVIRREFDAVLTNSGKSAFYLKKIHGVKVRLERLENVIRYVCT